MSKVIQPMDAVVSGSGTARSSTGKRSEGDDAGGFSRLLSAGRAEQAGRVEGQNGPESGRKLPGKVPGQSGPADTDREVAGDAAATTDQSECGQPAASQPVAETAQSSPVPESGTDVSLDLAMLLTGEAVVVPVVEPETLTADDAVTAQAGAATEVVAETAAPAEVILPPDMEAEGAVLPQTAAVEVIEPQAQAAAAGVEMAPVQPDGHHSRPAPDPVTQAVREAVVQSPVLPAAEGSGGEAMTAGEDGKPALPAPSTAASRNGGASIISFGDTLIETGSSQPSARVPVAVGQPGWGRAVGEQVVWFVSQNIQSASLKLNPRHLGPLELQLSMDGDRASIAFTSQHAVVREALETSLPRLRDMFAEQGLDLVNVNVSQQDGNHREQHAAGAGTLPAATVAGADEALSLATVLSGPAGAHGLVDYYV